MKIPSQTRDRMIYSGLRFDIKAGYEGQQGGASHACRRLSCQQTEHHTFPWCFCFGMPEIKHCPAVLPPLMRLTVSVFSQLLSRLCYAPCAWCNPPSRRLSPNGLEVGLV
jgi:hypothetical protein